MLGRLVMRMRAIYLSIATWAFAESFRIALAAFYEFTRGDLGKLREYRVFRTPKPLLDPVTKEVLGYEAVYLGSALALMSGAMMTGQAFQMFRPPNRGSSASYWPLPCTGLRMSS